MNQKTFSALIGALMLAGAGPGHGAVISIDPDGVGGFGSFNVAALDWQIGNSIAVADPGQSVAANGAFAGQLLTAFAHAALGNFQDSNGDAIGGTGLNTFFQWTAVSGYRETIVSTGPTALDTTRTAVVPSDANFFRVYYDTKFNSSNTSGKGFEDGHLILEVKGGGSGTGVFTPTVPQPVDDMGLPTTPLDGFDANQYPGYKTLVGQGSATIFAAVTFYDPAFFTGLSIGTVIGLSFTTQQFLNYLTTNPSSCYWDGAAFMSAAGNGLGCGAAGDFGTISEWNGIFGPNVAFAADASTSFNIPEPGVLALLGLSLLGFGWASRRKSA